MTWTPGGVHCLPCSATPTECTRVSNYHRLKEDKRARHKINFQRLLMFFFLLNFPRVRDFAEEQDSWISAYEAQVYLFSKNPTGHKWDQSTKHSDLGIVWLIPRWSGTRKKKYPHLWVGMHEKHQLGKKSNGSKLSKAIRLCLSGKHCFFFFFKGAEFVQRMG